MSIENKKNKIKIDLNQFSIDLKDFFTLKPEERSFAIKFGEIANEALVILTKFNGILPVSILPFLQTFKNERLGYKKNEIGVIIQPDKLIFHFPEGGKIGFNTHQKEGNISFEYKIFYV